MRLAFEDVSYSYEGGEAKKKRGRRKKDAARQADWGNAPDAVWALRDVTFTVEPGEFFGVAGHTGSGKSTLIQHMNGLVHPTCGRVLADGRDLGEKGVATEVRRQVGLVFQYPENQLFANTVYDDVAFGPRNMGLETPRRSTAACGRAWRGKGCLSTSFPERSPLTCPAASSAAWPSAGVLSPWSRRCSCSTSRWPATRSPARSSWYHPRAARRTAAPSSWCPTPWRTLAALCDRILVLSEGRLFRLGTPAEVFADAAALKAVGLGAPASEAFASLRARPALRWGATSTTSAPWPPTSPPS